MTTGPVEQIAFRTAIGAVNKADHLRIYSQDVLGGIRESLYEGGWSGGVNALSSSKLASPLAATSRGLDNIRLYYISSANTLREFCYDSGRGWYDGGLNASNFAVAPYSQVAATYLLPAKGSQLRIYAQSTDNTIQEYGWDGPDSGWQKMTNLGAALPGTSIATTSYAGSTGLSIRTYFQTSSLSLTEQAFDNNKGWYTGGLSVPASSTTPRASIAVTSFNDTSSGISLRVYYSAPNNSILEKGWDNKEWYDGGFSQVGIPGSRVAAISWQAGSSFQIRVYFQKGVNVTAVSEWCWSNGWTQGRTALPPA